MGTSEHRRQIEQLHERCKYIYLHEEQVGVKPERLPNVITREKIGWHALIEWAKLWAGEHTPASGSKNGVVVMELR